MDQRAIIDAACKAGIENLATEIGALLGQELTCSDVQLQLTSKESIFSDPDRAKTALVRMAVSGDKEGDCYLLTQTDSAILLGGTLIMLPEDMIEENVRNGTLDGELNDAFGEVANIIAGVFTQVFVDKYAKTIRFIKDTVEELVPAKIDLASDEPFPPGNYYRAGCKLIVGEKNLGPLELVVPAAVFELEEDQTVAETASSEPAAEGAAEPVDEKPAVAPAAEAAPADELPTAAPKPVFAEAKKLTDVVFKATIGQLGEEIGALVGRELVCDDIQLLMTGKEDFFASHCVDKSTMFQLEVSGDRDGCGFMFTQIPDAILLGGTLIMLPTDQIEEQQAKNQFAGEVADAFGEVANILAGGLTQVFLDRYPKQLRFVRTESEIVVPTKVDPASEDPIPQGDYYLASFAVHLEGQKLNRMFLLFPAEIFDLDGYPPDAVGAAGQSIAETAPAGTEAPAEEAATVQPEVASVSPAEGGEKPVTAPAKPAAATGPPLILVISDETGAAQPFAEVLSSADFDCQVLNFQEDVKALLQQHQVLGAFLIMSQVNEKGFATAIKLQSGDRPLPPMIFAGPEWTRTTVLRAVKYGAHDILVMPASGDEIQQKISQHFRKAS